MNALAFNYSIRLPLAARPASSDWLGAKFLATLDALTELDANIFPDWEVGDLPAMKGYPLAIARSRIAEIIGHNVQCNEYGLPQPEDGYSAAAHTTIAARPHRMRLWIGMEDNTLWLKTDDWNVFPDPAVWPAPGSVDTRQQEIA